MPYRYRIFPSQQIGVVTIYGATTGQTFVEATTAMSHDEAWSPTFDRLWDCREITFLDMAPEHVNTLIRTQMEGRGRAARGALVASRESDATMALVFKAAFRKDRPVEIFRTMDEALTWLGKDLPLEPADHVDE